jgi:hypothetical protein
MFKGVMENHSGITVWAAIVAATSSVCRPRPVKACEAADDDGNSSAALERLSRSSTTRAFITADKDARPEEKTKSKKNKFLPYLHFVSQEYSTFPFF